MASLTSAPQFNALTVPGTPVLEATDGQQCSITASLGSSKDLGQRFHDLIPIPAALGAQIKQGIEVCRAAGRLRHKSPVWAFISDSLLEWFESCEGPVPPIEFLTEKPTEWFQIYGTTINMQDGVMWFQGEHEDQSWLKPARIVSTGWISSRVTGRLYSKGNNSTSTTSPTVVTIWTDHEDVRSLVDLPRASLDQSRCASLETTYGEPEGVGTSVVEGNEDESIGVLVIALGTLDKEDSEREDVMPIPDDHGYLLKVGILQAWKENRVPYTEPIWVEMGVGNTFTDWLKIKSPMARKDALSFHWKRPKNFFDSHSTTVIIQNGGLRFVEEERGARLTAKNPNPNLIVPSLAASDNTTMSVLKAATDFSDVSSRTASAKSLPESAS